MRVFPHGIMNNKALRATLDVGSVPPGSAKRLRYGEWKAGGYHEKNYSIYRSHTDHLLALRL